jgi:orotate phosphoribosyltransferase
VPNRSRTLNYRSVHDLNQAVVRWSRDLDPDFDLVVGVPRSGLLAASLLGLHLHLPVMDLPAFLAGVAPWSGLRLPNGAVRTPRKVLILDDTANSGAEQVRIRAAVAESGRAEGIDIRYGAVYVAPGSERKVDVYAEVVALPRVFEWNVLYNEVVTRSCMDIDGVLCADPKPHENDDGRRYRQFLSDAELRYRPSMRVGTLVTSRLEKYRPETEAWLAKHSIAYGDLVMLDLPSAEERRRLQAHVPHKARTYAASGAELFIESSVHEGRGIHAATGLPVFVTDTRDYLARPPAPRNLRLAAFAARADRAARGVARRVLR